MTRLASTVGIAFALAACHPAAPPEILTHHYSIEPAESGNRILAAGDTLSFRVDSSECHADVCQSTLLEPDSLRWSVSAPDLAVVTPGTGLVRALRAGTVVLRAQGSGTRQALDTVRIYPPVARLEWTPRPSSAAAGDTLRIGIVARDTSGREVGRLPAHSIMGGTGASGDLLDWGGATPVTVWLNQPGTLTLVARLAHRWDTLRIEVDSTLPSVDSIPDLGAIVRVRAPTLGVGWKVGIFNMLMISAQCHRVLIFGRSSTIAHTLSPRDLVQLQRAERTPSSGLSALPQEGGPPMMFHAPAWREVNLAPLMKEEERCDHHPAGPSH